MKTKPKFYRVTRAGDIDDDRPEHCYPVGTIVRLACDAETDAPLFMDAEELPQYVSYRDVELVVGVVYALQA